LSHPGKFLSRKPCASFADAPKETADRRLGIATAAMPACASVRECHQRSDAPERGSTILLVTNAGARGWFAAWCAVGAVFVLGVISLGPLLELPALIAAIVLLTNAKARSTPDGLLVGAGLVCFLVASLNRGGSGTSNLNPHPWLFAGFLLVAVPLVYRLSVSRSRRTSSRHNVS
jgi:hypothetical protein